MDGAAGRPGAGSSGTQPPASPVGYSGPFLAGTIFEVTQGNTWFQGYWWYVPAGGDTGAQKFALWNIGVGETSSGHQLVPGSVTSSGALAAGQFNEVLLPEPIPLAVGTTYNASTGWTAVSGFPQTLNQFGSGDPYSAGIVNGPLSGFSDTTGSLPEPYSVVQGLFDTSGSDPSLAPAYSGASSSNFWMDVQVTDIAPASFAGPFRLWPNKWDSSSTASGDSAFDYSVATVFTLAQSCSVIAVGYYSQFGASGLATEADIWSGEGLTGTLRASIPSPSWSGPAGSGWVWAYFASPPALAAGTYKAAVYNANGTAGSWQVRDTGPAGNGYWNSGGPGANGISYGPLSAPDLASAPLAFVYQGGGSTETGQSVFEQGPPDSVPNTCSLIGGTASQNYWVDVLVVPAGPAYTASAASM
jgi:hypothetical protein